MKVTVNKQGYNLQMIHHCYVLFECIRVGQDCIFNITFEYNILGR
jgi:hypothetical protein